MATRNDETPSPRQLRKLRESVGFTQTHSANLVFVTLRTWQNWELGKHRMHRVLWACFQHHVELEKASH